MINANNTEKAKKRKLSEVGSSKIAPPSKKPAIASVSTAAVLKASAATTIKREPKVVTTTVKDAKSDSSFFSAPKPKPKLPSFKKAPATTSANVASVTVKKELEGNVAQPSSIDPFQEVLKAMKGRNGSPAASSITSAAIDVQSASAAMADTISASEGPRKKRKTVTWAADGQLEQVKLIERAIYDDDPAFVRLGTISFSYSKGGLIPYSLYQGMHAAHSIRDLERGEGAALHAHLFEELIDWYDPPSKCTTRQTKTQC
jgi:protein phosphatase 1 regulatory subunit 10